MYLLSVSYKISKPDIIRFWVSSHTSPSSSPFKALSVATQPADNIELSCAAESPNEGTPATKAPSNHAEPKATTPTIC